VILAETNIAAGMPLGAALARDNVAGGPPSRGRFAMIRLLFYAPYWSLEFCSS
jgi:hypothetical protein